MLVLRRFILHAGLVLIGLLIGLAVYGAFIRAERAQAFFNTVPAAFYWVTLGIALIAGVVVFPTLRRGPGLALTHAGCVLVLAGAIWGSEAGHGLQRRLFGTDKIRRAELVILAGQQEDRVELRDGRMATLPFVVALEDFRIEYYRPGSLWVEMPDARKVKIPARPGAVCDLDGGLGRIEVVRTFENCRIAVGPNGPTGYDDPNAASNPAVEVQVTRPPGTTHRRFVFERYAPRHAADEDLPMSYRRMVKDYISQVRVVADGKVVTRGAIEVNHPLHYAGYSLYQSSYGTDPDSGKSYTSLTVVCDCGLKGVFLGYGVLFLGVSWQLWPRHGGRRQEVRSDCEAVIPS